jgi:hypothetical protein
MSIEDNTWIKQPQSNSPIRKKRRVRFNKLAEVRFLANSKNKIDGFCLFGMKKHKWNDESITFSNDDSNWATEKNELSDTPQQTFLNKMRKTLNCALIWFLFCYCITLLRLNQQSSSTFYVFLAYLFLFLLFFQLVIYDSSPQIERVSISKIVLLALSILSLYLLLNGIENPESGQKSPSEHSYYEKKDDTVDIVGSNNLNFSQEANDEDQLSHLNIKSTANVSTAQLMNYKRMLVLILCAFCCAFYLCNIRRQQQTEDDFNIASFVG